MPLSKEATERRADILAMREQGLPMRVCGEKYGISATRVSQILKKWERQKRHAERKATQNAQA